MKKITIFLVIPFFVSAFLTDQGPPEGWKGRIESENGVKVIINPEKPLYGEITLELEEDLVIGNDQDENYLFYQRAWPAQNAEGYIYILDSGNCRIQKFDHNGKFLASFGRKGQGPGEFNLPLRIHFDDKNNIYIVDIRKIHIFNSEGIFSRSIPLTSSVDDFSISPDGIFLAHTLMISDNNGKIVSEYQIITLDSDGKKLKTLDRFPFIGPAPPGQPMNIGRSFDPRLLFCPMKKGMGVYGMPSQYKLCLADPQGTMALVIKKEGAPVPITNKDKEATIESFKNYLKESGRKREYVAKFPKNKPYFNHILTDNLNNLYVRKFAEFDEKDFYYDFFNSKGFYLYQIKTFSTPIEIGDGYMYTAQTNPDTECLQIFRYRIKNWDAITKGMN